MCLICLSHTPWHSYQYHSHWYTTLTPLQSWQQKNIFQKELYTTALEKRAGLSSLQCSAETKKFIYLSQLFKSIGAKWTKLGGGEILKQSSYLQFPISLWNIQCSFWTFFSQQSFSFLQSPKTFEDESSPKKRWLSLIFPSGKCAIESMVLACIISL